MKSYIAHLTCGAVALVATGCVVSVGSHRPHQPPPAPTPVVVPTPPSNPAEAATLAEIDAAARLSFDSSRLDSLSAIARRPDLPAAAQVHLVHVAYRCLSFEHSKVSLLSQIIGNPSFSDYTRHAIVAQLGGLSHDSSRQSILKQLDDRLANR